LFRAFLITWAYRLKPAEIIACSKYTDELRQRTIDNLGNLAGNDLRASLYLVAVGFAEVVVD
jgi:hypothetical protein